MLNDLVKPLPLDVCRCLGRVNNKVGFGAFDDMQSVRYVLSTETEKIVVHLVLEHVKEIAAERKDLDRRRHVLKCRRKQGDSDVLDGKVL